MSFRIELDNAGTVYSNNLQIELPGAKRAEPEQNREWSTVATNDLESNLNYSLAQRKKGFITLRGLFYSYREEAGLNNDGDVSNGTLQSQITDGNIDVSSDPRFTSTNSSGDQIVKTIEEKIAWANEYIFANIGAPQHYVQGGQFNDGSGGKNVVVESVNATQETDWLANYNITMRYGGSV